MNATLYKSKVDFIQQKIGGVHELTGVRLPLQPYTGGHAVFMYSTAADGNVTLQLKEPDDLDRGSLAAMLARLQDDATFSISYQDTDILSDGSIDVLLGTGNQNSGKNTKDELIEC
ncbi:hypothetical protein WA026_002956 [Henosepilachna vigintioctopunctata]|uniref:Uncharacterized protein n=1 Tax=Henosepilachna vigintioctopunctata TaxID=420089 RepID=A0AAW1TL41_9CUCU